jgi:hypothetical protein
MFDIIDYFRENVFESLCIVLLLSLATSFFIIEKLYFENIDKAMRIKDLENLINFGKDGK